MKSESQTVRDYRAFLKARLECGCLMTPRPEQCPVHGPADAADIMLVSCIYQAELTRNKQPTAIEGVSIVVEETSPEKKKPARLDIPHCGSWKELAHQLAEVWWWCHNNNANLQHGELSSETCTFSICLMGGVPSRNTFHADVPVNAMAKAKARLAELPKCHKCNVTMKIGEAIPTAVVHMGGGQRSVGAHQGAAPLVDVWKCPQCGHSFRTAADPVPLSPHEERVQLLQENSGAIRCPACACPMIGEDPLGGFICLQCSKQFSIAEPLPSQAPEEPGKCLPCPWCIPGLDNCHHTQEQIVRAETARETQFDPKSPEATSRFIAKQADQIRTLTRERDEARDGYNHLVEECNAKQELIESAEARVKELEGELAEAQRQVGVGMRLAHSLSCDKLELEEKLATTRTSVSTPPRQFTVKLTSHDCEYSNYFSYGAFEAQMKTARLLHRIELGKDNCVLVFEDIPLPPSTQPEEETEQLELAKRLIRRAVYAAEYLRDSQDDPGAVDWLEDVKRFFRQAARQSTPKTEV